MIESSPDKKDGFNDMFQGPIPNLGSSVLGFICMPEVYALKPLRSTDNLAIEKVFYCTGRQ